MSNDINETLGISQTPVPSGNTEKQDKYDSLKKIAGIFVVLAWITGSLIFLAGIILAINAKPRYGQPSGLSGLLVLMYIYLAVLVVISFLAQAGIIKVLVDIEKNTRKPGH